MKMEDIRLKIDLTKHKMHHWFEDSKGNIYDGESDKLPEDEDYFSYHVDGSQTVNEEVMAYTYHPEHKHENNHFYHAMLQFPWFYKLMFNRMKKRGEPKTFKHMFTGQFHWSKGTSRLLVAMVSSGDYDLGEALYVYSTCCERCSNVLWNKYVGREEGYPEFSEEWYQCNTECKCCKGSGDPERREAALESYRHKIAELDAASKVISE